MEHAAVPGPEAQQYLPCRLVRKANVALSLSLFLIILPAVPGDCHLIVLPLSSSQITIIVCWYAPYLVQPTQVN